MFTATPGMFFADMQNLVVNASDFGPLSSTADSASTIQKAFNAAAKVGYGTVYLNQPALINSQLTVASDNIQFVGIGHGAQLIAGSSFPVSTPMLLVQAPGPAGNFRYGFKCADIFFNGSNIAGVGAIELDSCYQALIDHCRIRFCPGNGIYLTDPSSGGARGAYTTIRHCDITDGGAGIAILSAFAENYTVDGGLIAFYNIAGGVGIKNQDGGCTITNVQFDMCDTSVWFAFVGSNQCVDCNFGRAVSRHVYLNGTKRCIVANNYFDQATGTPSPAAIVYADNSANANNIIAHNTCIGTGNVWTYGYYEAGGIGTPGNVIGPNQWNGLRQQLFTGVPSA